MDYWAHSANADGKWQPLSEHLLAVRELAAKFAESFDAAEEARLLGLLHDIGKYADSFDRRLHGLESGLDHWSPGAWAAWSQYKSVAAALAVQGHHVGLQIGDEESLVSMDPMELARYHPLGLKPAETDIEKLLDRMQSDGLAVPDFSGGCVPITAETAVAMLDVRMLFSTLVDADYLDTEAHFNPESSRLRHSAPPELNAALAYSRLMEHMESVRAESKSSKKVNGIRDDLTGGIGCPRKWGRIRGSVAPSLRGRWGLKRVWPARKLARTVRCTVPSGAV